MHAPDDFGRLLRKLLEIFVVFLQFIGALIILYFERRHLITGRRILLAVLRYFSVKLDSLRREDK